MDISVVLPCLNEAETISICIKKAKKQIKKLKLRGEIVIADNGSNDGSIEIAKKLSAKVINVENKGYGNVLRAGIKNSKGKFILIADADDSYNLNDLPKFYKKIVQGFDIVQGCRLPSGGGKIVSGAMPFTHRIIGNPIFSYLTKKLYQVPFNDVYCGMKILRKSFFKKMNFFSTGMVFCLEILIKSKINNAKMGELPITLFKDGRKKAKSHLKTISDGLKTLKFIMICSPKFIFFIPSLIFLLSIPVITFVNFNYWYNEFNKLIFIGSLLLFLSIQFFMLGIYSTLRAKQIKIYKGNFLDIFFKYFKLRLALLIGIGLLFVPIILGYFKDFGVNETSKLIFFSITSLLGINIIANSFFVSLLEIGEKDK
jgi:glycosyltransferase involved in cell wall biosynthesis